MLQAPEPQKAVRPELRKSPCLGSWGPSWLESSQSVQTSETRTRSLGGREGAGVGEDPSGSGAWLAGKLDFVQIWV